MLNMTLKFKIGFLMFLAVCVILAIGFVSYRSLSLIVKSINRESYPDLTSYKIKEITSDLEKAENGVRIYAITRNKKYLQPFYKCIRDIDQNNFISQNQFNSEFLSIYDTINQLIEEKILVLNEILVLYKDFNIEKELGEISKENDSLNRNSEYAENKKLLNKLFYKRKLLESDVTKQKELLNKIGIIQSEKEIVNEKIEKKEIKLAETSGQITEKLNDIIELVEKQENLKKEQRSGEAKKLSKETYNWILSFSIFGTLLTIIALFILARYLRKSNAYQKALLESKKAAEDLVRAKEIFIANVSHELRTPLNAISGFTEQLIDSKEKNEEFLSVIKSSSDHLIRLINDLLDYSKLLAGKLQIENENFFLSELVSEVMSMFKLKTDQAGIKLDCHIEKNIPHILYGDAFKIKQIIINLLSNAIKFSENGKVKLNFSLNKVNYKNPELIFEISDTGIGIEKEKLNTVFEDFTQEEPDISRKFGGTGLGLSIVKKLIDLHGGEIKVESEKNVGTKFTCKIPCRVGEKNVVKSKDQDQIIPDLCGLKILVVDDAEYNRKLLNVMLSKWGAVVHEAENGMDAIDNIKTTIYDLIFLDVRMPVLDGFKTIKFIRNGMKKNSTELPVFIISAVSPEEKTRFDKLDINGYITKPVSEEMVTGLLMKSGKIKTIKQYSPSKSQILKKGEKNFLNLTDLNRLAGNDNGFVDVMLKKLTDVTDKELINLDNAIENKEWNKIADIAHKICPPFKHIGSKEIVEGLKELENIAKKEKDIIRINQVTYEVKNKYNIIKSEIDSFIS